MEVQHVAPAQVQHVAPPQVVSPVESTDWALIAIAAAGALGVIVIINKMTAQPPVPAPVQATAQAPAKQIIHKQEIPDKTFRMCTDYRKIHSVTKTDL